MPRSKRVPRIHDPANLFERESRVIFDALDRTEIIKGVAVTDVDIATATTRVPHTLGRIPKGFIVIDTTGDTRIYRDATMTTERATYLYLKASTAATVSLWVF